MILSVVKVALPALIAFLIGLVIEPFISRFLYKNEFWKKRSVQKAISGGEATISQQLHNDEARKTPRMGGLVMWISVLLTTLLFWLGSVLFPGELSEKLNFLSRNQTWLPLFTLLSAALIGLVDDYLVVSDKGGYIGGGLPLSMRILLVILIGLVGGSWFYTKLEVSSIIIPFLGEIGLGLFFIPLFIIVMLSVFSGGIIDGIDGLSGGIMATIFSAYAGIAFFQNQIDIAAFCAVVVGGLIAFLWFNIPPAKFFLSETGMLALTTTISVIAFLTKQVAVLPVIAFMLYLSSGSAIIQILSKRFRAGKKVFLVAPIHNHFQALGWPGHSVTMRFWIISAFFALTGLIIVLIG